MGFCFSLFLTETRELCSPDVFVALWGTDVGREAPGERLAGWMLDFPHRQRW